MISRIDAFLRERSWLPVTAACLLLILVLAALDHTTGYELSFSIFYLLPIAFATWYVGLYHGVLLSIVSAFVWLIVDITAGNHYSHTFIPFWNAGVRFLFLSLRRGYLRPSGPNWKRRGAWHGWTGLRTS